MFSLYFSKKDMKIVIEPVKTNSFMCDKKYRTGEVVRYNDCYYASTDRKKLREFAYSIIEKWRKEAEENLEALNKLKIINKY